MAKIADLRKGTNWADANGNEWVILSANPSPMGTQATGAAAPNYVVMARRTNVKHPLRAQDLVVNQDMLDKEYLRKL